MKTQPLISPNDEHKSLVSELRENKKYIFERPLITVGAILAIANFADKQDPIVLSFLPPICIALLYFNLWFTVNRIRSGSRIIAYIQLVLEQNRLLNWQGWETFLSEARSRTGQLKERRGVAKHEGYVQHNFYSPIFWFHLVIVVLSFVASILLFYSYMKSVVYPVDWSDLTIWVTCLALLCSTLLFVFFLRYVLFSKKKNPRPREVVKLGSYMREEFAALIAILNEEFLAREKELIESESEKLEGVG